VTFDSVWFVVAGVPIPQGSSRAFVVKGRAVVTSSNKNLAQWRQRIATEAQRINAESGFYREGKFSYTVCADFFFPRTKSMGKKNLRHTVRPDLDKIQRAVGDGITGVLIPDDAQIDRWSVTKNYLPLDSDKGPRVEISVLRNPLIIEVDTGEWPR
jgi:crossover junction endodeoxyribonuclease RusA